MMQSSTLLSGLSCIITIPIMVLEIVAYWKLFEKAGEEGWKSLIPVYSGYMIYKIGWQPAAFWLTLALAFLTGFVPGSLKILFSLGLLAVHFIFCYKLAQSFGKGIGFTLGLFFLNPIFMMILGLDNSRYQG